MPFSSWLEVVLRLLLQAAYASMKKRIRWSDTIPAVDIIIYMLILLAFCRSILCCISLLLFICFDLIYPNVLGFKLQQSPSSHGLRRSPGTRCSIHPPSPRSPTWYRIQKLGESWRAGTKVATPATPDPHLSDATSNKKTARKHQVVRDSKSDVYRKAWEATTSALPARSTKTRQKAKADFVR